MTTLSPLAASPSSEWVEGHLEIAQFEGDFFRDDYGDTFPFPEDGVPVGSDKVDVEEKSVYSDSEDADEEGFSPSKTQTSARHLTTNHQQPLSPDPQARAPSVPPVAAELPTEMDVDEDNRPDDPSLVPGGVSIEGHNCLKKAPVYVSKFGGQAGKPLTASSSTHGVAGYSGYAEQTGGHSENIWAPFKSKLEWEIVQWAKLRGHHSPNC